MGGGLSKLRRSFMLIYLLSFVLGNVVLFLVGLILMEFVEISAAVFGLGMLSLSLLVGCLLAIYVGRTLAKPIEMIATALGHLSPGEGVIAAPNLATLEVGREITEEVIRRVYDLAGGQKQVSSGAEGQTEAHLKSIFDLMPAAVVALNGAGEVTYYNEAASRYMDASVNDARGNLFSQLFNLNFGGSETLNEWLERAGADKITDSQSWQRVRHTATDGSRFFFDMAAFYSKDQPSGNEVIVAMIDHSQRYMADEEEVNFVSLAVHELRTPITLLRGYIEVFEQELGAQLSEEMRGFMTKMTVAAAQLSLFINNILNVSRIENNQFNVNLSKVDWRQFIEKTVSTDLAIRAAVRNRKIRLELPPAIPFVAADSFSIYEVLSNLVDNAIKYSHDGGEIVIRISMSNDGMVETTVQDFGIGIPQSIIGHLFEKFYRSHRSKQSVGGTGLGLYLSKIIIEAHNGHIAVQSTEGQGAVFSFTLPTYDSLGEQQANDGIERGAHGWIKNHSLYRG